MKKISELLSKFEGFEHPDIKKKIIAEEIKKLTGLDLDKTDIDLRGKNLFIRSDGYKKTEIFLRRDEIIEKLNQKLPNHRINAIL